uniref:uncharacterized protein LOC122582694 n=1 Tax=Erigeron canadensis TaxID=72917 RepID=UPI001CB930A6|nr:uncharacterized protein LOC122582694 [Erigeron canadensis]
MEKPSTVKNQKLSQKSNKRKPVKVVYISNPMKIKATPSEFRAIVQQLTGRYAASPPSPDDHDVAASGIIDVKDNSQEEENQQLDKYYWHSPNSTMSARRSLDLSNYHESGCRDDDQVIMEDLVVNPQMLDEGFPSLLP